MFKDEHRYEVWNEIRQHDIRAFCGQLTPKVFAEAARRTGVSLVRSPLCLVNLVWLGIASAIHATDSFANVLVVTLKLLEDQQGFAQSKIGRVQKNAKRRKQPDNRKKHDPRQNDPTCVSEEAFVKARRKMLLGFWINLIIVLGERFEQQHGQQHCFRGFRVLAIDGTRLDLPNWKQLKDHFGTAKNSSGAHNAQARMVVLQFPFTRLPFRYELAPLADSEVTMALRLVQQLEKNDLLLMDAGYWSYQLLWAITNRNAFFAMRLRKGLNLKTLKRLDKNGRDRLVRWTPKDSRGNWRKLGLPRSIDFRVVQYRVPGYRVQSIVTNVTDPSRISREDWSRLTTACQDTRRKLLPPGLFHRRWEIETSYYELKVDLGLDRHLRSRTVDSIQWEVAGYMVYYMLLRWLMVEAAVKHGVDPLRLSFVEAKRELEAMRTSLVTSELRWVARVLLPRLLDRIASHQVLIRPGRHYPRKKKKTKTKNSIKTTNAKTSKKSKKRLPQTKNKG